MSPWIVAAFLLSGLAGLMHEIVWSRLLAALIGTTALAQAAVLVVYMGGLALGSILFGRRSDWRGGSLRTYALLEYAIALYCLSLPLLLGVAGSVYVSAAERMFEFPQAKLALRFVLALLTILLPAVLMGGTLPLLVRGVVRSPQQVRQRVALLYAANNFGAVLGAALAGFITLPLFGIFASLAIASTFNAVAGTLVWPFSRGASDANTADDAAPAEIRPYAPRAYWVTLLALVLAGFAAMGYEVAFLRIIALGFGATTYSFTVMLMSFITGIGLGSLLVARRHIERPLWWLGVSQLCVVVAMIAATPLLERFPYYTALIRIAAPKTAAGFLLSEMGKAALCLIVLLIPTVCMGIGFPLVTAVQARHPRQIGAHVGATYAYNTVGNVLGVLVTSLILLPRVGLLGSFHVNLALSAAAGTLVLAVADEVRAATRAAVTAGFCAVVIAYGALRPQWTEPLLYSLNHLNLNEATAADASAAERAADPTASFANWKRRYLVDRAFSPLVHLEEEAHASVLVAQVLGETVLAVNTKSDASTSAIDMQTQLLLAHAPLFLHPGARSLLVIGYGSGITLGSALRHPIERADVVEISAGVLRTDFAFAAHNYGVLHDPRVHVYLDDAQSFLKTVPRRYDVIISEPSNPWIAGIAGLFTVEFFANARDKLEPGGVFALWFHEYDQSDANIALILRTLTAVFPNVTLFHEQSYADVVAVASTSPLAVDFNELERRFDRPEVRSDLTRIGIPNLAALLSHNAVSPNGFPHLFGPGPLNLLNHQRLEYDALRSMFLGDFSELVERANPLLETTTANSDVLLDRYIAFRTETAEPIRRSELSEAANHMSTLGEHAEQIRSSLLARAERAAPDTTPPTRPARGAVPEAASAEYYEADYWGRRFAAAGDLTRGVAYERRALELRPDAATIAVRLSDLLVATGDLQGASRLIDAMLVHQPDDFTLLSQRGWLYIRARRFSDARQTLSKLTALNPLPTGTAMIAHLLVLEGRPDEGAALLAKAAESARSTSLTRPLWQVGAVMAKIVAGQGDRAGALVILEGALRFDPEQPTLLALRAALRDGG